MALPTAQSSNPRPASILGTRVLRVEDPAFLTTGAIYTEDLVDDRLAGALHAVFVRSPIAHARLGDIDTAEALAQPGVTAVLTAADLTDLPERKGAFGSKMPEPVLATDVVRFVGQPVAVVLAETREAATDAAELVEVDYQPLPALVDPEAAARDELLLFPEAGTNTALANLTEQSADLLDGCEVVITQRIVNNRVAPAPLETRAAAAVWAADGDADGPRLTFWLPNQGAQGAKAGMVRALGVSADRIHVITPEVGGAFGAKFGVDPDHIAIAAAARIAGRPVRWTETRSENLMVMPHGRAQVQHVTIGGTRDGRMIAYRLEVLQDSGAYPRIGVLLPGLTALMAPGVYTFDRVEASTRSVVTTTTPVGAFRGAGRLEAAAALERAVDLFAAEIGMDPAEVRRRNMLPAFAEPHTTAMGAVYDSGDYPAALENLLQAADYDALRAEQARRRARGDDRQLGIGLAVYVEITGGGDESGPPNENATVTVHPDGSATILTGTSPHGQGHATAWAMLASEELGIPVERFTLRWGDTDLIPEGGGTGGSRSLQQGGVAVRQAAIEVADLAKQRASALLEVDPADLEVDTGRAGVAVVGIPDRFVSFAELAESEPLSAHTVFTAPGATFPFGAHLAVVEVDVPTGKARLQRFVGVDDSGTILNPLLAEGQRHGGLAQGAAQALYEEVCYDEDGNPLTASFADYGIVSAPELPDFELVPMATPTSYNPLGAKGIGESGTIGATPAVQNAVVDAVAHLGVRHIDMPATPQRVWRAIQQAQQAQPAGPEAEAR
jgi:carbon-monoxide dehydrogenase large subunit